MSKINKLLFIIGILSLISLVIGWLLFKTVNKKKNLDNFSKFLNHHDLPNDQDLNDSDAANNWDINGIMKKFIENKNSILNATTETEAKDKKINFYHELVEIMAKMAPYQNKFNIQEKQFYDVQLPQITSEFINTNYPIRYEILDKNIDPQKTKIEANKTYSKIISKFNQNDELVIKEYYVKTLNFEQLIRLNEYYQANKFKKIITYYHMDDNYMIFNINPNDPKIKPKLEITEYNLYGQRQDTKYNREGQIISIKPPIYETIESKKLNSNIMIPLSFKRVFLFNYR